MMKKRNRLLIVLWVVFSLPVLLVIGIALSSKHAPAIEINPNQFAKILQQGDARDVVLVRNKNFVELTLTHEALSKSEYQDIPEKQDPFSVEYGPHYSLRINSPGILRPKFF